jgi:1,4-alpha-glucan branching enzyme
MGVSDRLGAGAFPTDRTWLGAFDGTALYEHEDRGSASSRLEDRDLQFRAGREVSSIPDQQCLFWASAITSTACAWMRWPRCSTATIPAKAANGYPMRKAGRENWEAVEFLRAMNRAVYGAHPGFFTVREESTSWPGRDPPA